MFRPVNLQSPEVLFKACEEIQAFVSAHYAADNPDACVSRGNDLEVYMAQTGKMLADAKWHHNELIQSAVMQALKDAEKVRMSTSTINKYIDSLAKDYQYLVDWIDRLNKTCTHQLDFLRTIISKHKADMYFTQGTNRT